MILQMWSENDGPFEGRHYQLAETLNSPQPVRRPPIMIGGGGEKKTLRLVAKYGDACNLFAGPHVGVREFLRKMDVLAEHCAREGTDFDRIHKTLLYPGPPPSSPVSAEAFVEAMAAYAEAGADRVFIIPMGPDPVAVVHGIAQHAVESLAAL